MSEKIGSLKENLGSLGRSERAGPAATCVQSAETSAVSQRESVLPTLSALPCASV